MLTLRHLDTFERAKYVVGNKKRPLIAEQGALFIPISDRYVSLAILDH